MQLIYFGDPMCSWCWGFAPVLSALSQRDPQDGEGVPPYPIRYIVGGLRAYNTQEMQDADRSFIRQHWQHVHSASGQPFDFAFFDRPRFTYDTEPACRAVVTTRILSPGLEGAMFHALQSAFYAGNTDITSTDELVRIAEEAGLDPMRFAERFASEEVRNETARDFAISQKTGIQGFPTLLAGDDEPGYHVVTTGYLGLEDVRTRLAQIEAATLVESGGTLQ